MRLAARSVRHTPTGRLIAVAAIAMLLMLLVGRAPAGFAADITGTITVGGPAVTVTISTAGDNAALTFDGTQGQRVSVNLTSVTIGSSACCSARASIRKPDGSDLVSPKLFGTAGGFLDTVVLPSSGTYTIYIDPDGSNTGSVTVTAYDVPPDVSGSIVPGGSSVTVSMATPGRNAALTFQGTQDQRVSVNLTSVTVGTSACCSTRASIRKPDGSDLVAPKLFGTAGGFLDAVSLPTSGTYTIYVDPQDANTGSVTVSLYDVPPDLTGSISLTAGPVRVSLTVPGQNGRLAFEAAAGQVVRVTTTEVTIAGSGCCSAHASIENPDGSTLGGTEFFGTVGGTFTRTLTSSGTHAVFIDPVNAYTGSVTVTLRIAGESPANGAAVRTLMPTLRVGPASNPNTDYYFEVASDSTFTNIVESSGALPTTTSYRISPAKLNNGTTYYWRWKRLGGAWSSARSFVTQREMYGTREQWPMWSYGPLAVNKVTGNLVLSLPGPSYPTAVGSMSASVTYNSRDARNRGLGAGWTLDAGADHGLTPVRLTDLHVLGGEEKMDAAEVLFADGDAAVYSHVGQTNTYVAEPGDGSLLSRNVNGTWTLIEVDGSIYTFGASDPVTGIAKIASVEFVDAAPGKGKLTYAFSPDGTKITSITDGAGRQLAFNWNSLNPSACTNAILCVVGPDSVTWRYVGDGSGGTSGRLVRVNNGTRDIAAVEYDVVGLVQKVRNANDLNPSAASPGYNPDHAITIAYCCGSDRKVMWISDGYITLADGGSQSATTWFEYYPGSVATTPTRAAHGSLPAGTARTAAGYTTVQPPRQHGAQNPKLIKSYYDSAGREIETVDILGNVTMAGYDARDNLLWTEDEDGKPTDYSWDSVNDVLLETSGPDPDGPGPLGRPTTKNRYDEQQIGTASTPGAALAGLQGSYFANRNLAGRPDLRRTDGNIDFNWSTAGPAGLGATDNFSARWTGNILVPSSGSYTFSTNADDGTRLTVDGVQLIDNWVEQTASSVNSRPVTLPAGAHKILLEYFDATGPAQVQLRWSCTGCTPAISLQPVPSSVLRPAWFNQTSVVSPLGKVSFSHFADPAAMRSDYNLERLGDGTNVVTSFTHDSYGRITQKVMPKGNAQRTIDGSGNLQGSADLTYATSWTYYGPTDAAAPPATCGGGAAVNQGELLKDVTPRGVATTTYVYDLGGRSVAVTKGIGSICRSYDAEGRLTSERAPGDAEATTYTYDPGGAVRSAQNANGAVTSDYDEAGRTKRSIDSFGAEATFLYDRHGNVTRRVAAAGPLATSPNHVVEYAYDDADRMTTLTDPAGRSYAFTYDRRDNLRTVQYPNGTFAWHDYNAVGWLTARYNRHGTLGSPIPPNVPADSEGAPLADFTYTYELEGRKTQETRAGGAFPTETTSYIYDALGRLSEVTLPNGTNRRYVFDLDSNRSAITENGTTVSSYTYDPGNPLTEGIDQLASVTENGQTRTFEYRPDGEMTKRGADTINWDGWGRHTGGTFGGTTVSYGFDPLGFRRSRTAGTITTHYRLSGLYETDSAGAIQLADIEGPAGDLAHYAGPPATGTAISYLYYNGHGDVIATADQGGARTNAYSYDPFGAPRELQPQNTALERFTGRWDKKLDTTSSLIEMGVRPYDPGLGRFLSIDPVDGGSLNVYDYAYQEPVNVYDLDGRYPRFVHEFARACRAIRLCDAPKGAKTFARGVKRQPGRAAGAAILTVGGAAGIAAGVAFDKVCKRLGPIEAIVHCRRTAAWMAASGYGLITVGAYNFVKVYRAGRERRSGR